MCPFYTHQTARPHQPTPEISSDLEVASPRAIATPIFGFETILTGLIYLSFGIFLYQMIQRAVEARISFLENPNGRDFDGGEGGEVMTAVLDSLEKVRDKMGKAVHSWPVPGCN